MPVGSAKFAWPIGVVLIFLLAAAWAWQDKKSHTLTTVSPEAAYCDGALSECVGKKIQFFGMVDEARSEHLFWPSGSYMYTSYLTNKAFGQVVIYTQSPLDLPTGTKLDVVGTVVSATLPPADGATTNGGSAEEQILVDEWKVREQ